MDFNKVFTFNTDIFHINDSEYKKLIEKSLRKLSKVLIHDSFLGYESTTSHIEKFVQLLAHHKKDYTKYYKVNYDKLKRIEKGFYCEENGFTTNYEKEILALINKVDD
ncbi:MAG: hypothetical protein PF638_10980, partial [Candidatus Delongbacteria bacterium]|nr:hypothetical protein [Candidatus Delongbacteria bacterium]